MRNDPVECLCSQCFCLVLNAAEDGICALCKDNKHSNMFAGTNQQTLGLIAAPIIKEQAIKLPYNAAVPK